MNLFHRSVMRAKLSPRIVMQGVGYTSAFLIELNMLRRILRRLASADFYVRDTG